MGRRRKNAVHAFYAYDKDNNNSECQVPGCSAIIKGNHATNLLYHLSSHHPDKYNIVIMRNNLSQSDKENETNAANISNTTETSTSTSLNSSTNSIDYIKAQCVDLVTVHGRPFALMDDVAFKNIINMTNANQRQVQFINSHNIKLLISQAANNKRAAITDQLKGRMISLKVDSATRLDRSFFAVNAQYILDGSIHVIHLGVTELHARSTAEYLKEKLLYILRKYRINIHQIYSITTDNGANMLKMAHLLNNTAESDDEDEDVDVDIEPMEISLDEDTNSAELASYSITSIRCAAHTLQLAINDALSEDESMHSITEARSIVRKLRTPSMRNIFKLANKKKPILDVTTRWHSTLDMLERLVELREFCSVTPGDNLYVGPTLWDVIDDLIKSLKPAKILTKLLQDQQLNIGDFYYHWSKCYLETSHLQIPLAQQICKHMKLRELHLMLKPTFVSALYLDARFHVVLSADEQLLARRHLCDTWAQMIKVEENLVHMELDDSASLSQPPSDAVDEIELILRETERLRRRDLYNQAQTNIMPILENFSCHPRVPAKSNILLFWKAKAINEPQLYRLSNTVLAAPATQVSVERFFSSLKFVLSDLRYNLNDEIVEDILILRNNR